MKTIAVNLSKIKLADFERKYGFELNIKGGAKTDDAFLLLLRPDGTFEETDVGPEHSLALMAKIAEMAAAGDIIAVEAKEESLGEETKEPDKLKKSVIRPTGRSNIGFDFKGGRQIIRDDELGENSGETPKLGKDDD